MDVKEEIGLRIKTLRVDFQLTQEKLSYASGVDKTYISEVENGKRNISIVNLNKLINALNLSFSEFFNTPNFKEKVC